MVLALLAHGVGLALVAIIGLMSNILHFIKFYKSMKRTIFDKILLQGMVFNVLALIFGFFLTSLSLMLDHHDIHSNSHIALSQVYIFGAYVGLGGSSFSMMFLLLERVLKSSYPKAHGRLNIIWISILVSISVIVMANFYLLEYEVMCIGGGFEGPHENVIGICPDGKKAYVTYSQLRANSAYRAFVILEMLVTGELFPLVYIPTLLVLLLIQNKLSQEETLRTFIACCMLFIVTLIQLVPISYEVHTIANDYSTWEFHQNMPMTISVWYHVAHFIAMLLTAAYPWVFNGADLLVAWIPKKKTNDREMLLTVNDVEDETNICSYRVCKEVCQEELNSNPAYTETI